MCDFFGTMTDFISDNIWVNVMEIIKMILLLLFKYMCNAILYEKTINLK